MAKETGRRKELAFDADVDEAGTEPAAFCAKVQPPLDLLAHGEGKRINESLGVSSM
jgi:hypothetical protein